ncbi:sporulation protein YjcZ [Paenibacillus sp. MMO-177]
MGYPVAGANTGYGPVHGVRNNSAAFILVLFVLLVIIIRTCSFF